MYGVSVKGAITFVKYPIAVEYVHDPTSTAMLFMQAILADTWVFFVNRSESVH